MYSLGVNFDLTYITAGIVDKSGTILLKESIPTLKYRKFDEIVKDMAHLCIRIVNKAGLNIDKDIEFIGIGCYGSIDSRTGVMIYSSYFGFRNAPIAEEMKKYVNIPVVCENDANCYALAESRIGATKGLKNTIIVTIGTAISGGIIIENNIYHGLAYGAGEFGHHVIIFGGEKCECGRNGCWAAYASTNALVRDSRIMAIRHPESMLFKMVNGDIRLMSFRTPFEAAQKGDVHAKELVDAYTKYVALGLINIVNILQPEAIAIGGKIRKIGQEFINNVDKKVTEKTFGQYDDDKKTRILMCDLDYDAVIIGATMLRH
ncbi:ROK family protein [Lachnospiraceae bacterium NSJ-143]|nr:ROK family protein [Lachnospiraceae bacterium NSJ-143]